MEQVNINEQKIYKRKIFFKYKMSTVAIIAVNVVVFLIFKALVFKSMRDISLHYSMSMLDLPEKVQNVISNTTLLSMGAKYGPYIYEGQFWRIITCAFLHASVLHIGCNMFMLYSIGPEVQYVFGKFKYLTIYFVSCITSSIMSLIVNPDVISVGASGGIFGLMGALLAFIVFERNKIDKRYIKSLISNIVFNLLLGITLSNIDNAAHIGGFLGGFILGLILYKLNLKKRRYS